MRRTALVILLALITVAILTIRLSNKNYALQERDHISEQASRQHWSGTDDLGRDRTVRLAGALLLGLAGAVSASALATSLAVTVGVFAAFAPKAIAACLMYFSDLFLTLPWLFLLMMVRSALPLSMSPIQSATLTFLLLGLLAWPAYARITYAGAISIRNSDCMIHGRALGLRKAQLARHYVLPHLLPLTLSQFVILIPVCLVAEANLGTLGMGVSEPLPSWGSMLLALQHPPYSQVRILFFYPSFFSSLFSFSWNFYSSRFRPMLARILYRLLVLLLPVTCGAVSCAQKSGSPAELTWSLRYDPKTFDPAKVDDQASEMLRFLTGGVLLRLNRRTQQIEPALAESWNVSQNGRLVTFHLRSGLRFSDGSPLGARDVAATLTRLFDPATAAPVAEEFLSTHDISIETPDSLTIKLHLPKRIMSIGRVFDEIAIEPAGRTTESRITAGSYVLAEYKRGEYIRLQRNPLYWRRDSSGATLPYLPSLRLDILSNREQDQMRFIKGKYQIVDSLPAESYGLLARSNAESMHDLGPSLNTEQMWFNQSPKSPLPAWEKAWFQSRGFRVALSQAIHRADLVRIAYDGHATSANGFVSPANSFWYNKALPSIPQNTNEAMRMLVKEGFHKSGAYLFDHDGHPVKFSILTNAGNRSREKMAALIQQDLLALGIQVNVITLDFPALIERLMHSQDYEAIILGLSNVNPDPSAIMNIWLSSSANHQWNPSEPKPATEWEAEIDQQMQLQATAADDGTRKHAVDRVQQIAYDQQPFIYLVYPNMLYAVSPMLAGVELSILQPGVISNIDLMYWKGSRR